MRVICEREPLLAAFSATASVAPSRSPHPILKNIKFEVNDTSSTLLATDLEIGVRFEVPGVKVEAAGSAVLPIDRFSAILRESHDAQLRIESDGQGIHVQTHTSQFNLPAENPDEFPIVAQFNEEKYHELPARLFRELIRRTVYATDIESTRYALGGVLVELTENHIVGVGTDGRRLAKMEGQATCVGGHQTGANTTIIPTRAMAAMERLVSDGDGEVKIAARPNDVLVHTQRCTVYTRLVEGRFPKWRDVLPNTIKAHHVDLPVGPFHSAVRQAAITTSEESRGVDFTFGDGKVLLTARSAEKGQSRVEMPISYEGAPIAIMLDPQYLSDFLKVLDSEKTFRLHLMDGESPAVCETDDGYTYVIMPLARDNRP